jgi:GR25 family glycosyltransferase involved in LPS biosynthesis
MEKYVDNVYLINMDKDTERLIKVTKECKKFNINFERFNGIIGCGVSHLKIYEDAIKIY